MTEVMQYILIGIGPDGTRCAITEHPVVPDHWLMPGEMGFIVQPLDIVTRYEQELDFIPNKKFL